MARIDKLENFLQDVSDSIKTKREITTKLKPENFDTEILNIETGITPTETIEITENGSYDVTNMATAIVNVELPENPYEKVGTTVLAQALENFDSGDTFVGTKVGINKEVTSTKTGLSSVVSMSADLTVALKNEGLTSNLSYFTFYFYKNGSYIEKQITHNLDLESKTCAYPLPFTSINEDGTICAISFGTFIVICHINKENETVEFYKFSGENISSNGFNFTTNNTNSSSRVFVRGNYIVSNSTFSDGTNSKSVVWVGNIQGSSITDVTFIYTSPKYLTGISGCNKYGENDLLFVEIAFGSSGYHQYRVEIENGKVISYTQQSINGSREVKYTQNGKFGVCYNKLYKINQATGTFELYMDSYCVAVSENAEYYYASGNIYDITDLEGTNPLNTTRVDISFSNVNQGFFDTYFNIISGKVISPSADTRYSLTGVDEAEYTIVHTGDGDIKGIVPNTMVMGDISPVQKLF